MDRSPVLQCPKTRYLVSIQGWECSCLWCMTYTHPLTYTHIDHGPNPLRPENKDRFR